MYTYSGQGYLVPIVYGTHAETSEYDGVVEEDFLAAYAAVVGDECEYIEEIDDAMVAGDWNSPDNTSEATLDGDERYGERGYMIALDESPKTTKTLAAILIELGLDPESFHGYVNVECYD